MPRPLPTTNQHNVIELSFNVAELIKAQTKLEQQLGVIDQKNDRQHEATRTQIRDLRNEVRSDFPTKGDLELVKADVANVTEKADGTSANINKIALGVIATLITAVIGLFFFFAQKGIGG